MQARCPVGPFRSSVADLATRANRRQSTTNANRLAYRLIADRTHLLGLLQRLRWSWRSAACTLPQGKHGPSRPLLRAWLRQPPAANGLIPDSVDPSSWPGRTVIAHHALCTSINIHHATESTHDMRPSAPSGQACADTVTDLRRAPAVSQSVDSSGEVTMEDQDDEDIEAKMEEFLRLQAERESGTLGVACAPVAGVEQRCNAEPVHFVPSHAWSSVRCCCSSYPVPHHRHLSVLLRVLQASHLWHQQLRRLRSRSA